MEDNWNKLILSCDVNFFVEFVFGWKEVLKVLLNLV